MTQSQANVMWVLEPDVFPETHAPIRSAIEQLGHTAIDWSDEWWSNGIPENVPKTSVVFHGSLGNAARIHSDLQWAPGSYCPVNAFYCSAWYEAARDWLVHPNWEQLSAIELVNNARSVAEKVASPDRIFVRPDSPLKPFSGRVVDVDDLSLAKLDHGFYYEDEALPVIVAPVQDIGDEYRFVVVSGKVVAVSRYDPVGRSAVAAPLDSGAASFAAEVASSLPAPAGVYILDVCECRGGFRLMELNPFGGADLYACDPVATVDAVSASAASDTKSC